jgi:hypothetical protein
MPHLSELARKYNGRATFIGVERYTLEVTPLTKIRAFVDSMGKNMDYHVAIEDSNYMSTEWVEASGDPGLPGTLIVNGDGKIAWIGHPMYIREVLPQILNNNWDIEKELAKRNFNIYLDSVDREAYYRVLPYSPDNKKPGDPGKPELALLAINSMVINEPALEYAPHIAFQKFVALLKTDPAKAYEYGKKVIVTRTYEEPAWYSITDAIKIYEDRLQLPANIFELGAEAYQGFIEWFPYPQNLERERMYTQVAAWQSRAGNKRKAIAAQEKAIAILKTSKDFSAKDLNEYESLLKQYRNK